MPRDASGNYTLPAGNPVVSGTIIEATWANNTMPDLGNEITDSLSRSGEGGMLAPLKHTDGTALLPSLTFLNEIQSGIYLAAANDVRVSIAGTDRMRWNASAVQIWNGASWDTIFAGAISSDDVTNDAVGVDGATVTEALEYFENNFNSLSSNGVANESLVSGVDVTAALNTLNTQDNTLASAIAALNSTQIANSSGVAGSTVTDALNALDAAVGGPIDTDDVGNASGVAGATATEALNTLNSAIAALGTDDIDNDSTVVGATASDALETLSAAITALGSDDIANDSSVTGATVTDALETLDASIAGGPVTDFVTSTIGIPGAAQTILTFALGAAGNYAINALIWLVDADVDSIVIDTNFTGTSTSFALAALSRDTDTNTQFRRSYITGSGDPSFAISNTNFTGTLNPVVLSGHLVATSSGTLTISVENTGATVTVDVDVGTWGKCELM